MAPSDLILVRHGESAGNVAREAAEAEQAEIITVEQRDADVPLTERGRSQATALGSWLAALPTPVGAVWTSPYVRAAQTCAVAVNEAHLDVAVRSDDRLRDRELGVLDRLTKRGVLARYPEEADRRRHLGKLYYRPPGGESWADVALRLRSFLADRDILASSGTTLVVAHDAVILLFRYVLEDLGEQQLLDLAAERSVGNASITWLTRADRSSQWEATSVGASDYLTQHGSEPTSHGAEQDAHPR